MATSAFNFQTTEGDLPSEVKVVDEGLGQYNGRAANMGAVVPFACLVRGRDAQRVIGGALARRWGGCCELQQLWVDDRFRGAGLGREIMQRIEAHAASHGCTLIFLDTFSFQCPAFYAKLGNEVVCQFEGFPDGISKLILQKRLQNS